MRYYALTVTFWLWGPIKEQDFTFSFDCLVNTAFWLADGGGAVAAPTATAKSADKFVFISPSFYLEASVF